MTERTLKEKPDTPKVTPPPSPAPTPNRKISRRIASAILILLLGFAGGAAGAWVMNGMATTTTVISRDSSKDGNVLRSQNEQDISEVVKQVAPSVVSIATNVQTTQGVSEGAGTGIIVSKDGYVMTNSHVVDGARTVSVTTTSGDIYDNVKVIGSDPLNDVAFLKIPDVDSLEPASIGDSSTLHLGQNVFAIGNSLGEYKNTVTSGIVSGLNRPVSASSGDGTTVESLTGLVQTDAAINPGNSGGPLVNSSGQVVGINTAVASDAQGIGFAIPVNATKGVLASVIEDGKVARAYLGVRYIDLTPAIAKEYKLDLKQGAFVSGDDNSPALVSGGPADKAGIKDGDVITEIGDMTVGEDGAVMTLVGEYRPGDTISVTYVRDGKTHTTKLTLQQYDDSVSATSVQEESQQRSTTLDPRSLFGF